MDICKNCSTPFEKKTHNQLYFYHNSFKRRIAEDPVLKEKYETVRKSAWNKYNHSEKNKLNQQAYRDRNPDRLKIYYEKKKEEVKAKIKDYQAGHADLVKMWRLKYRKGEKRKVVALRYAKSPKGKNSAKRYRSSEKGLLAIRYKEQRRRARERQVVHAFTKKEWSSLRDKTNGFCPKCNNCVGKENLTIDHV